MRTIKFRAWGKDFQDNQFKMAYEVWPSDIDGKSVVLWGDSEFEEAVLMQFTGLLDKNGKEIYEGDIIEIEQDEGVDVYQNWVKHRAEVIYSNGCYFGIFGLPLYELIQEPHDYNLEVIGNIYEYPDLIIN